jgi:bifunctional NMN adenylyltransferase/nudix hydrolase
MKLHDVVRLRHDYQRGSQPVIPKGTLGTIVDIYEKTAEGAMLADLGIEPGYEIEFNGGRAETLVLHMLEEVDPRILAYRKNYGEGPFLTGDSVVVRHRQNGKVQQAWDARESEILLVQRGKWPGEGMWALPGGFMNPDDPSVLGCAVRELDEETKLRLDGLPNGMTVQEALNYCHHDELRMVVGDALDRDPRARIISHCFLFDLRLYTNMVVTVEAADDARDVTWKTPQEIEAMTLFADHNDLIKRIWSKV